MVTRNITPPFTFTCFNTIAQSADSQGRKGRSERKQSRVTVTQLCLPLWAKVVLRPVLTVQSSPKRRLSQ